MCGATALKYKDMQSMVKVEKPIRNGFQFHDHNLHGRESLNDRRFAKYGAA